MSNYVKEPQIENSFDEWDEPRLHMEALMRSHLIEFDLPLRLLIPLDEHGIRRLSDLVKQTPESIQGINRIGKLGLKRIEELLERYDLQFGMKW